MFAHLPAPECDPILSLQETYAADNRPDKINLSIGLYYDEQGRVPELASVRLAQEHLAGAAARPAYLPMAGSVLYRQAVQDLLFGREHASVASGRIATVQTIGASGALRLGADLLKKAAPEAAVWVSNPTWGNHVAIFAAAGFKVRQYPYYDAATGRADFAAMAACLDALPPHSIVLLHPCCHNPTGADLADACWDELARIVKRRQLVALFDLAYQGYGAGVEKDRYALLTFAEAGIAYLVCNSFSKTFSLYGERCGALSVVCNSAAAAAHVLGHMEMLVRRSYSSPPAFGAGIVAKVLLVPELRRQWEGEVDTMRQRIETMRAGLYERLAQQCPGLQAGFLLEQRGMFSYSGLDQHAVARLREQHGIYLIDSGRLCLTGLNDANLDRVALALAPLMHAALAVTA